MCSPFRYVTLELDGVTLKTKHVPKCLDPVWDEKFRFKGKKDKLLSRLYQKALEDLLSQESNTLHRCAFCSSTRTIQPRNHHLTRRGTAKLP